MSEGKMFILIILGCCGLVAIAMSTGPAIRAFKKWRLLAIANDPAKMRARNKRELEKESLKQKRKDEKRVKSKIADIAKTLRDNGKASTEIKTVAEWFKERGYEVEPPMSGSSYYRISIPEVTDKELTDIILGENK